MSHEPPILILPPERLKQVQGLAVTVAHRAYRIGQGGHLFREGQSVPVRGGLMAVTNRDFDGRGEAGVLCDEVVRECAARGYQGLVCCFEAGTQPVLERGLRELEERFDGRRWRLYVPEGYAHCTRNAGVLIPSALSGGSLQSRLEEGLQRYGHRVVLKPERVAEDFLIPAPDGRGRVLSQAQLEQLRRGEPSVFYSHELCQRYFTYRDGRNGVHFVVFDDGDTLRRKIRLARGLGIGAVAAQVEDVEPLLGGAEFPKRKGAGS